MEENYRNSGAETNDRDEIYSQTVRAGRRTYFFDVKTTKGNDYYLTITESKKRFHRDGQHFFEKHKIFLYKEDLDKFQSGLSNVVEFIKTVNKEWTEQTVELSSNNGNFTDVNFDDLESTK